METWQELLEKSNLKIEKLRKQVKEDISDYEDALKYLSTAKTELEKETDESKKADIQKDIDEIEADLPVLSNDILEGVKKDVATLEKRRETARKTFGGKAKAPVAAPVSGPVATPQAKAPVVKVAAEGVVIDEEKKEGKTTVIEWVVGGVLFVGFTYLGLAFNKDWYPFKNRR